MHQILLLRSRLLNKQLIQNQLKYQPKLLLRRLSVMKQQRHLLDACQLQ
jgi:hypothetical protein